MLTTDYCIQYVFVYKVCESLTWSLSASVSFLFSPCILLPNYLLQLGVPLVQPVPSSKQVLEDGPDKVNPMSQLKVIVDLSAERLNEPLDGISGRIQSIEIKSKKFFKIKFAVQTCDKKQL